MLCVNIDAGLSICCIFEVGAMMGNFRKACI